MTLFLAILQPSAVMAFKQAMLGTEVAVAETAVAYDGLDLLFALSRCVFLEFTCGSLSHAAAKRKS